MKFDIDGNGELNPAELAAYEAYQNVITSKQETSKYAGDNKIDKTPTKEETEFVENVKTDKPTTEKVDEFLARVSSFKNYLQ